MKKSPLSMPCGSNGNQNCNWKSYDHKNRTGYNYVKSDSYQCTPLNATKTQPANDFIPLNISTPLPERKRFGGNWHGTGGRNHRNSGSGGFNHYRNNYHTSPKSNFNNSYSPYKHTGKQYYGQKKGYQRNARKQVNISNYIDMKSFLEDPWAELTRKLNQSEETNRDASPKLEHSFSSQLISIDSEYNSECKSITTVDSSSLCSESVNESTIDTTLGLDDTGNSNVSNADSSVDLKLDGVTFGQESKNNSVCSNDDSASEDINKDDNIQDSCVLKPNAIQDLI